MWWYITRYLNLSIFTNSLLLLYSEKWQDFEYTHAYRIVHHRGPIQVGYAWRTTQADYWKFAYPWCSQLQSVVTLMHLPLHLTVRSTMQSASDRHANASSTSSRGTIPSLEGVAKRGVIPREGCLLLLWTSGSGISGFFVRILYKEGVVALSNEVQIISQSFPLCILKSLSDSSSG